MNRAVMAGVTVANLLDVNDPGPPLGPAFANEVLVPGLFRWGYKHPDGEKFLLGHQAIFSALLTEGSRRTRQIFESR
jgi:hypothetical protein